MSFQTLNCSIVAAAPFEHRIAHPSVVVRPQLGIKNGQATLNGELNQTRFGAEPAKLDQATVTNRDLTPFAHCHSQDQFDRVMAAVRAPTETIKTDKDACSEHRFMSRKMPAGPCLGVL